MVHTAFKFATMISLGTALHVGAAYAQANEPVRELGAHQHGRGNFSMAIEKGKVSIDLEAPAVDLVGFEHMPKTQVERDAVEAAKRHLLDPLKLFGVPQAAGCKVVESAVELESAHHHDHDDKTDHKHDAKDTGHTEFQAQYVLECATPAALTTLDFTYFEAFPGAASLEIIAISEKSQIKADATRKSPKVALTGLM